MAYNYQSFATLGVNLNRQNYGSLDISQVFTSQADLNYYMSKGSLKEGVSQYWLDTVPYPYAGQYVALVDNATRGVIPYILTEKEDGTFEATKLGVPEVDGETIKINEEGKLEAIIPEIEIPEYVDTNTTYKLSVAATEESDEVQGVKITLTPYNGEIAGTPQSYIIADPDLSDYITTSALTTELDKKANKDSVYTKTETDAAIGKAVSEADHLKRKIVNTKEEINVDATDAMQYIYMVPVGTSNDDNKYREYIVLEKDGARFIEQVGNWEVDLSGYLTEADAANTYATAERADELESKVSNKVDRIDVYITSEVDNKFATKTELEAYAKTSDIPTDYVTTEQIADYETATQIAEKYVAQEEGKSLLADSEIERLAKVNENAEENYINSIDEDIFTVTEEKLGLKAVPQKIIGGLTQTSWTIDDDDNFVATTTAAFLEDILKPATYNAETRTGTSGLMTAEQVQKLQALVIGEEGIEISGTVNADNVTGLGAWITTNRDKVEGLYPTAAGNLLDQLNTTINAETTGLVTKVGALETKVGNLEQLTTTFDADIKALKEAMTWGSIQVTA